MSLESREANNARLFRSLVFDLFLAMAVVNLVIAFRICREVVALSRNREPGGFCKPVFQVPYLGPPGKKTPPRDKIVIHRCPPVLMACMCGGVLRGIPNGS